MTSRNRPSNASNPPFEIPSEVQMRALRVRYVLDTMPDQLRSDLLSGENFTELPGFRITQTIALGNHAIERDALCVAVRSNLDSGNPQVLSIGEGNEALVLVEENGVAIVEISEQRFRFENADLLASDGSRRAAAAERALGEFTVSASVHQRLWDQVRAGPLSFEDFFEMLIALEQTAQGFARRLGAALRIGKLSKSDLIVANENYWTSLLPAPGSTKSLEEYRDSVLFAEWRSRLKHDSIQAFNAMALAFVGPSLVPQTLFAECPLDVKKAMLRKAERFSDPYGIAGAIQLCLAHQDADVFFVEAGERLLSKLSSQIDEARTALVIFCAVYIVVCAELASSVNLQSYPSWWRRLAAAIHASLFVDSCGIISEKQEGLVEWAWDISGARFTLAIAAEMHDQPRWRAEWISPEFLFADLVGRLHSMEPNKPEPWRPHIQKLYAELEKKRLELHARFPALLEGALPMPVRPESAFTGFENIFEQARVEPSPSNVTVFQALVHGWAMPDTLPEIAFKTIEYIISDGAALDNDKVAEALIFCAQIAVIGRNVDLANRTAQAVLTASVRLSKPHFAVDAVVRLVMCAQVEPSPIADEALAGRLEQLVSLQNDKKVLRHLVYLIGDLGELKPGLRSRLARAVAMAELGTL